MEPVCYCAEVPREEAEGEEDEEEDTDEEQQQEYHMINEGVQSHTVDRIVAALKPAYALIEEMLREDSMEVIKEGPPVKIYLRKGTGAGMINTKSIGEIPAPAEAVLACLRDRKPEFDKDFECETTLEELDTTLVSAALERRVEFCGIRHSQSRSPMPVLMDPRDTVAAICTTRSDDGSIMVAITSVEHPRGPEQPSHIRAEILAIGLIITPLDQNRTLMTKVVDVNVNGRVPKHWMVKSSAPKMGTEEFTRLSKACCDETKWPTHLRTRMLWTDVGSNVTVDNAM